MAPPKNFIGLSLAAAAAALLGFGPPIFIAISQASEGALASTYLMSLRFMFIFLGAGLVIAGSVEASHARPPAPKREKRLLALAALIMALSGFAPDFLLPEIAPY